MVVVTNLVSVLGEVVLYLGTVQFLCFQFYLSICILSFFLLLRPNNDYIFL